MRKKADGLTCERWEVSRGRFAQSGGAAWGGSGERDQALRSVRRRLRPPVESVVMDPPPASHFLLPFYLTSESSVVAWWARLEKTEEPQLGFQRPARFFNCAIQIFGH